MKVLLLLFLVITLSSCKDSSSPSSLPVHDSPGLDPHSIEVFLDLMNQHRGNLGLPALILNEDMNGIAKNHSVNMANKSIPFGHQGLSSRCGAARVALGGGNWCAENVAQGQKTPKTLFQAWINSSGHRANIESARATHVGLGHAQNSSQAPYWTLIFLER